MTNGITVGWYQVEYIYHDCFVIKFADAWIVFDYFAPTTLPAFGQRHKDDAATPAFPRFLSGIPEETPLYVLVSHHHKDHFSRKVFEWQKFHGNTKYIISKDVERMARHILRDESGYKGFKPAAGSVITIRSGETWQDSGLEVRAYRSTDIGNSYVVERKGLKFFHAGDLNAWVWRDESTEAEIRQALGNYTAILKEIRAGEGGDGDFEAVMFPVDSRIGSGFWEGAALFLKYFKTKVFFPMHFCLAENLEELEKRKADARDFALYCGDSDAEFIALQSGGDTLQRRIRRTSASGL